MTFRAGRSFALVAVAHREDDMAWQASLFSFFILGVEKLLKIQVVASQ